MWSLRRIELLLELLQVVCQDCPFGIFALGYTGMKAAIDMRGPQIYLLSTLDPYLNLAIEEHLFDKMAEDSAALLLYTNGPSVILGKHW